MMKYRICLFTLLACFSFFGNPKAQEGLKPKEATAFEMLQNPFYVPENAKFYDKQGNPIYLTEFKGKIVVLNFWKATCIKCLIELPSLNRLKESFEDKNIIVLAISEGEESAEVIEKVLYDRRLDIPVSSDKEMALLKGLGGTTVPRTLLINSKGQIIGVIQGLANFDAPELQKQLKDLF